MLARWRISLGDICSGLGTAREALLDIQDVNPTLEVDYVFASDVSTASKTIIMHNHPECQHFYDDVCGPEFQRTAPPCDLLVAGYPCQPFSSEGLNHGGLDPRASVIAAVLAYVFKRRPIIVLLENVLGLLHRHADTFHAILGALQSFGYSVSWQILNSERHGGVPKSRHRLYHVGILSPVAPMRWPTAAPAVPLDQLIDNTRFGTRLPVSRRGSLCRKSVSQVLRMAREAGVNYKRLRMVIDVDGRSPQHFIGRCPCLTKTRASSGFWLLWKGRRLNIAEMMRLQGMKPARLRVEGLCIRPRVIGGMVGNAFTQSVVGRVMLCAIKAAGLAGPLQSPWAPRGRNGL